MILICWYLESRQKKADEAIVELEVAARLMPENSRYIYVYAVALNSTG